ncbi:MAG: peptidoglycan DD-metalloendopeptidase family protein [Hyphomonadaceae bacterium]
MRVWLVTAFAPAAIALSGCAVVSTSAEIVSAGAAVVGDAAEGVGELMALHPGEQSAPPPGQGASEAPPHERQIERSLQGAAAMTRTETRQAYETVPDRTAGAPRLHVARAGETLPAIAALYGADVAALEQMNGLTPPYEVREGDMIVLPDPALLVREESSAYVAVNSVQTNPPPISETRPTQTVMDGGGFYMRPVRGEVLTRFGAQAGGRRVDGIELAAEPGAAIAAAAEGDVVYAGAEVAGYDSLVLIRHGDGGVTAYGYAGRMFVREGAHVARGQTIAEAGSRGRILFQVRRGTSAVDPLPLLGD